MERKLREFQHSFHSLMGLPCTLVINNTRMVKLLCRSSGPEKGVTCKSGRGSCRSGEGGGPRNMGRFHIHAKPRGGIFLEEF